MKKTGLLIKKFSGLQIKKWDIFFLLFFHSKLKLALQTIHIFESDKLWWAFCSSSYTSWLGKKVSTKPGLSLLERDQWEWLKLKLVQICDINSSLGFFLLKGPQWSEVCFKLWKKNHVIFWKSPMSSNWPIIHLQLICKLS